MAKISKEELNVKISERIEDIDLATELLEDIADSFDETDDSESIALIENLNEEIKNLKQKYKERFTSSEKINDENETEIEDDKIIDIKEI